jgi:hypothetical protein
MLFLGLTFVYGLFEIALALLKISWALARLPFALARVYSTRPRRAVP